LEKAELPSKTRLIAKDISNTRNAGGQGGSSLVTNYDMINIYNNRKHFFSIVAELDNILVVFEYEIDANGNYHGRAWQWT
jgi:hypothetical protein